MGVRHRCAGARSAPVITPPHPRVVLERLEDGSLRPVAGSAGIDALYEELASGSPRRLLIGLRTPIRADEINRYGPDGPMLFHQHARQARQAFLDDFHRDHPEQRDLPIDELDELPYVAFFPSAESLAFILDHPDVVSINTESGGPPLLNESIPFIGADIAHGLGHTGQWRTIAVLDTGVDRDHPMFAGKVVSEACYSSAAYSSLASICRSGGYGSVGINSGGRCTLEKTPCTVDPTACLELDCQPGHGSHVAGIAVGAAVFPGGGVPPLKGVAHGANLISIMPLSHVENESICGEDNSPCVYYLEFSVAAALNQVYALRHSHAISSINLSLHLSGFGSDYSATTCDAAWPAVRDAANLLASAGIRLYGASGNYGNSIGFQNKIGLPSCLSNVVSVGATSKNSNVFASYSNAAEILDLLAPGGLTNYPTGLSCRDNFAIPDGVWSAYSHAGCSDDYFQDPGTSMASPHAAGAHVVVQSRYPSASARAISDWMIASGAPVSFSQVTWGQGATHYTKARIDLAAAMTPPPAPGSAPASGTVDWMACLGQNVASWASVSGNVTEYQLQGESSLWPYYTGSGTAAVVWVTQSENLRVRACNMVACGPWATIGYATYQPHCH